MGGSKKSKEQSNAGIIEQVTWSHQLNEKERDLSPNRSLEVYFRNNLKYEY